MRPAGPTLPNMNASQPAGPKKPFEEFKIRMSLFTRHAQVLAAKRTKFPSWNAWAVARLKEAADRDLRAPEPGQENG